MDQVQSRQLAEDSRKIRAVNETVRFILGIVLSLVVFDILLFLILVQISVSPR